MKHPVVVRGTSVFRLLSLLVLFLGLSQVHLAQAQSYVLTNLWSVGTNSPAHPFVAQDNLSRGMAYNPASGHVLVVSRTQVPDYGTNVFGTNGIFILDSATGGVLGKLPYDTSVISGGTFVINMIGVTDDGVIYVCNLTTDATNTTPTTGPLKLYRWANESAQPELAYSGDPSAGATTGTNPRRFGDSLALRGTGTGTQILLGTYNQAVGLLRTADGTNFTATKITTDMAASDSRWGLAWGAGDTFWVKQGTGNLKELTLDLNANTAAVTRNVVMTGIPGGPMDIDLSRNLLAIVDTTNHRLRMFDISNPSAPVQLDATQNFPHANANGNSTGAAALRGGRLFAFESNNGLLAYSLHLVFLPPGVTTHPGNVTVWDGAAYWTYTVGLSGSAPFAYQWQRDGTNLVGETQSTLTISNVTFSHQGLYRVVVTNVSGSVTSNPSQLTVRPASYSGQVTNIWNVQPDVRPYLTSGYREYGVAINPLNTNVIVLTRPNPTNMLVVLDPLTGAEKHYIDYSGLTLVGGMNKVDVAEDGTIYICNQTTSTASTLFTIYGIGSDLPYTSDKWIAFSGDPGNGVTPPSEGWGRTFTVRGAGLNTEILVGQLANTGTNVAILKPDGNYVFSSTLITITNAPAGFARLGLDWGPGNNTLWATAVGSVHLVEFDVNAGKGFIKKSYPTTGSRSIPSSVTGIKYDPAAGLLAGLQNGTEVRPVSVPIYDVTDVDAGPLWVDHELFTTHNPDIEYQGNVDFAAGYLVALGVNNGLKAFKVNTGIPSLPSIVTHPASTAWYEGTSPFFSVVADSATPVSYQWYYNGTEAVVGGTNAVLTLTNVQLSQAGDYHVRVSNSGGTRDSLTATLTVIQATTGNVLTNLWNVAPGSRPYLNTYYFEYGMSYNPVTTNLLVASYVSTNTPPVIIGVMDALTGADKHVLDTSTITNGGNRWVNKIGVADDGVVYVANRTTALPTVPFVVYRWADDAPTTVASVAFSGDPFLPLAPNRLAGWTMDVRGAGVNTEMLLSTTATNVVSVLTTTDGANFTANAILVPGAPAAFARIGICFGDGNTFWAKSWQGDGGKLYLVQYDLQTGVGTILKTYDTDVVSSTMTTVAYNDNLKLLAGIARDDQKNVHIYNIADLAAGPELLDQEFFPTYNASIEANGALDFAGNIYLFALNENNGIMAMRINPAYQPPITAFKILSVVAAGGTVTLQWEAREQVRYQVQYAGSVDAAWNNLGDEITATGTTASYVDTAPDNSKRFYRILVVK